MICFCFGKPSIQMLVLLQCSTDTFTWGIEYNEETFPRFDFRGGFLTLYDAFKAMIEISKGEGESTTFSIVEYYVPNHICKYEHTNQPQYKANSDYVMELETGEIIYIGAGKTNPNELFAVIEQLVAEFKKKYDWRASHMCDSIYQKAVGRWTCNSMYLFSKPGIYNLNLAELEAVIKEMQNAVTES